MLQLIIIKNLLIYEVYNKYRRYIKIGKDNKELIELYRVLDGLFTTYKRTLSPEEYSLAVLLRHPEYGDLLKQIESSNISQDIIEDSVKQLVEQGQAYDLALVAIEVSEGKKPFDTISNMYEGFDKKEIVKETSFVTDDLEELYEETRHKKGLRWRLQTLNTMLGSIRKGDFGFIYARPEVGKTTFLASEVTHMATQTDKPFVWFNFEEQGSKVKIRLYQASLACDLTKLYSDRPRAYAEFIKRTKGNIKLYDSAFTNRTQIEAICKEIDPALIIFDPIDKVKGFKNDREDLRLGEIYIWARELAKTYCPVIGVCQADSTAEGKKWLDMGNTANSKTSKASEADWILGIGHSHELGLEHIRYLHLSKNKLTGDEDTIPALRHGKRECIIRPEIARYEDFK
jgi:replicative DNA helicase